MEPISLIFIMQRTFTRSSIILIWMRIQLSCRQLVDQAHRENIRLKVYYTTREFTKNLPEFWALNSLNGEIVYPGPGNSSKTVINPDGPKEWYVKNLRENYIPAWYNEIKEGKFKGETDLSVITTPDSRLNNFYVAGLDWMVQNIGIDGVYIDDSALDRYTLMRARKDYRQVSSGGKDGSAQLEPLQ